MSRADCFPVGKDHARTTHYEYDLSGKTTKTIYPDEYQVYQVTNAYYPGTGLLHTVTGSDFVRYPKCSAYEPTGKMGKIEHQNGTSTTYTYDPWSIKLMESDQS